MDDLFESELRDAKRDPDELDAHYSDNYRYIESFSVDPEHNTEDDGHTITVGCFAANTNADDACAFTFPTAAHCTGKATKSSTTPRARALVRTPRACSSASSTRPMAQRSVVACLSASVLAIYPRISRESGVVDRNVALESLGARSSACELQLFRAEIAAQVARRRDARARVTSCSARRRAPRSLRRFVLAKNARRSSCARAARGVARHRSAGALILPTTGSHRSRSGLR